MSLKVLCVCLQQVNNFFGIISILSVTTFNLFFLLLSKLQLFSYYYFSTYYTISSIVMLREQTL